MSASGLHGQKKVSVSPEALALKATREKSKIDSYLQLCDDIHRRRSNGLLDEESLLLTANMLMKNPEFYTIWNYRREIILRLYGDAKMDSISDDVVQKVYEEELRMIESCLKTTPKSYWVWNHRRWVLETMLKPDWERELKLLNYMLDLDARNFHGWDYRRYVVAAMHRITSRDEFDYTTAKINQNFSNYSAWHYRSKLLTKAFSLDSIDSVESERGNAIRKDLELVRNAVFTDPADQSAWLYQRWLLGKEMPVILLDNAFFLTNTSQICLLFNQPVKFKRNDGLSIQTNSGNVVLKPVGYPAFTKLHLFTVDAATEKNLDEFSVLENQFEGTHSNLLSCSFQLTASGHNQSFVSTFDVVRTTITPESRVDVTYQPESVWEAELEAINELSDLEPDSKWPLLTRVHILRRLGRQLDVAVSLLDRLMQIDPLRVNCYKDLRSELVWEQEAKVDTKASNPYYPCLPPHIELLRMTSRGLTTIPIEKLLFVKHIDLSENAISSLMPLLDAIVRLPFLESVNLDGNLISTVDRNKMDGMSEISRVAKMMSVKRNPLRADALGYLKSLGFSV